MKKGLIIFFAILILAIASISAFYILPQKETQKIKTPLEKFLETPTEEIILKYDLNKDGILDHEEKNIIHEDLNIDKTNCPYKEPELSDDCPFHKKGLSDE